MATRPVLLHRIAAMIRLFCFMVKFEDLWPIMDKSKSANKQEQKQEEKQQEKEQKQGEK